MFNPGEITTKSEVTDISLNICRGEIIGLAGMEGSGQSLFLQTCAGITKPMRGQMVIGGRELTRKPYASFLRSGIAYVPASRLEEGLIPGLTLTEHFILTSDRQRFLIDREHSTSVTKNRIREFSIRGTHLSRIEELSGGNQQRALLALLKEPLNVLLLEHPTRGLDVESSIWIWSKLKERCRQGTSILFISSDLEEILHYSDRILVFFGGKVSQPLDAGTTTVDQLGQLIGGKGFLETAG